MAKSSKWALRAAVAIVVVALYTVIATPAVHADTILFQVQPDGSMAHIIQSGVSSTSPLSITTGEGSGGNYFGNTSNIYWNANYNGTLPGFLNAFTISSNLWTTARNGIALPGSNYPVAAIDTAPIITNELVDGFFPANITTGFSVDMSVGFAPVITDSCSSGINFNVYNQFEVPGPGCLPWTDGSVHELMTLNWFNPTTQAYDGTVDHIEFQTVPEPASFLLLGSGLLTICGRLRRRREGRS